MYHEEKVIDGVLCWRTDPEDEFTPYTAKELSARVWMLERRIRAAKSALED